MTKAFFAPDPQGRLAGKVAIVTGAGSGIGRVTALLFAAEGARVLGVDRNAQGMADVAAEGAAQGLALAPLVADLCDRSAAPEVFAACAREFGPPSILANIAGLGGDKPLHLSSDEDLDLYVDVNLGTVFRMCREAVRTFDDAGSAIVNISTAIALTGMRGQAPYSAAKAAVSGLTRQLAAEYGPRGIRVNAVAPGLIETPPLRPRLDSGFFDDIVTRSRPLPRIGQPIDIARAVAFLASDEASFITGVTLPVCGGWTTTKFRG
jgi:meso-butanediol dehydrogenase / (S,S)-butanediol dehydrogenase / diacetyl reductase